MLYNFTNQHELVSSDVLYMLTYYHGLMLTDILHYFTSQGEILASKW